MLVEFFVRELLIKKCVFKESMGIREDIFIYFGLRRGMGGREIEILKWEG